MNDLDWQQVRTFVDQAEPIPLTEITQRPVSADDRPGRRKGWVLVGAATVIVAGLIAGGLASRRDRTDTTVAGTGTTVTQTYTVEDAELTSSALLLSDRLWITSVVKGTPTLTEFDARSGAQLRAIRLPGEVTVGGMVAAGGNLWLMTVDELGTVGTGLVRVDPETGDLTQFHDLDRASTLATDGRLVWVRGQSLLQVRDAATGMIIDERNGLGFGWVTAGNGQVWMSDRDLKAVDSLDGVKTVSRHEFNDKRELGPLAWLPEHLFVVEGNQIDILDPANLDIVGNIATTEKPQLLNTTPGYMFALSDTRLARYSVRSGTLDEWPLPTDEVATALAIVNDHTVIVCNGDHTCRRYELS